MKRLKLMALGCVLALAGADWAGAQEPDEDASDPAAGKKSLDEQILGYWAPDWGAMAEKWDILADGLAEMRRMGEPDEDQATAKKAVLKDLEETFRVMSMEIKKGEIVYHAEPGHPNTMSYSVKSRDAATGILELQIVDEDDASRFTKAVLKGDRLTMVEGGKEEALPMVLDRIDAAAFKLRQKAAAESELFEGESEPSSGPEVSTDEGSPGPGEGESEPGKAQDKYPVARPVPKKPGYVFSPYNNNPVDVRDIPSGTLVQDPGFPASEKKRFRVP